MSSYEIKTRDNSLMAMWNDLWTGYDNFISANNSLLMSLSDTLFDAYCEAFCKSMKENMHEYFRNYPYTLRKKRQQSESI